MHEHSSERGRPLSRAANNAAASPRPRCPGGEQRAPRAAEPCARPLDRAAVRVSAAAAGGATRARAPTWILSIQEPDQTVILVMDTAPFWASARWSKLLGRAASLSPNGPVAARSLMRHCGGGAPHGGGSSVRRVLVVQSLLHWPS